MTRKEELQKLKTDELMKICKEKGIKHYRGKSRFKKDEMIEAILKAECTGESTSTEETKSAVDEVKVDNRKVVEAVDKNEKKTVSDIDEQKLSYIEHAEIGTIVACKVDGKVKSAKIIKRSSKKKCFMVETAYGAQYIVPYENVIWVRTGSKWPKGVYRALKGLEPETGMRGNGNGKAD